MEKIEFNHRRIILPPEDNAAVRQLFTKVIQRDQSARETMNGYLHAQITRNIFMNEQAGKVMFPEVVVMAHTLASEDLLSFVSKRLDVRYAHKPPFDGFAHFASKKIKEANRIVYARMCNDAVQGDEDALSLLVGAAYFLAKHTLKKNPEERELAVIKLSPQYMRDYIAKKINEGYGDDMPSVLESLVRVTVDSVLVDEFRRVSRLKRLEEYRSQQKENRIPARLMHLITDVFPGEFPDSRIITDTDMYRTLLNNFIQKYSIGKPVTEKRSAFIAMGQLNIPTPEMASLQNRTDIGSVKTEVYRVRKDLFNPFLARKGYYLTKEFKDLFDEEKNPEHITSEELEKAATTGLCESLFFMGFPYIRSAWFQEFRSHKDKRVIEEEGTERPRRRRSR